MPNNPGSTVDRGAGCAVEPVPWWPKLVLAAALLIHALMLPSLVFGYIDGWFADSDQFRRGIDFYSIYQAGTFFLDGHTVYDWGPADSVPYAAPYRYLPFFAFTVGAAFNILPAKMAYWVWVTCIEAMIAANALATCRVAPDKRWGFVAAATWYAFTPLYLEMYMGQWSFLMATLMLWTALLLHWGRGGAAAVPWALSVLIKTNSALIGPIFLRLGQWRALAASALALVALNAPYFLSHPGNWSYFLRINFGRYYADAPGRAIVTSAGDIGGLALLRTGWLAIDGTAQDLPRAMERAFVLGVIGLSFAATFLPRKADVIALFATWVCVYFLVYAAWEHHYVMVLPPLALLIALRPRFRVAALVAFVICALPTPYALIQQFASDAPPGPTGVDPENYWPSWAAIGHHSLKILPVLWLWALLVADALAAWNRHRRRDDSASAARTIA